MSGTPTKRHPPPVRGSSVQPQSDRPSLSQYHQQYQQHQQYQNSLYHQQQQQQQFLNTSGLITPSNLPNAQMLSAAAAANHQHRTHQMLAAAEFANSKHKFSSFNSLSSYDQPTATNQQQPQQPLNINTIRNLYLYNATGYMRNPNQQQLIAAQLVAAAQQQQQQPPTHNSINADLLKMVSCRIRYNLFSFYIKSTFN